MEELLKLEAGTKELEAKGKNNHKDHKVHKEFN